MLDAVNRTVVHYAAQLSTGLTLTETVELTANHTLGYAVKMSKVKSCVLNSNQQMMSPTEFSIYFHKSSQFGQNHRSSTSSCLELNVLSTILLVCVETLNKAGMCSAWAQHHSPAAACWNLQGVSTRSRFRAKGLRSRVSGLTPCKVGLVEIPRRL